MGHQRLSVWSMWAFGHVGFTLAAAAVAEAYLSRDRADRSSSFDYRLVAVSSVLPDIDKPIGLLLLGTFDRSYLHTLLAGIILLAAGIYLSRGGRSTWLLQVTFGWMIHMVLDQAWRNPHLLLWPLSGGDPAIGHATIPKVFGYMTHALTTNPYEYVPEMLGAAITAFFVLQVVRGGFSAFVSTGRIAWNLRG